MLSLVRNQQVGVKTVEETIKIRTNVGPGKLTFCETLLYVNLPNHSPHCSTVKGAKTGNIRARGSDITFVMLMGLPASWGNVNVLQAGKISLTDLMIKINQTQGAAE